MVEIGFDHYVGAVEEMKCIVCMDEGGIVVMDVIWRRLCVSMILGRVIGVRRKYLFKATNVW